MMTEGTMSNHDLLELEKSLRSRFYPIQPDQKFVGNLLTRLEKESRRDDERRLAISFLTIAIGLVTGLVVFLLGRMLFKRSKKNV